jgi:Flp pilus assembly protein TadD
VAGLALLAACNNRRNSVALLPPGLIESETRRLVQAQGVAADAYRTRNEQDAMQKYTEAVRLYRELPVAWNNLGVLLMKNERYVEASSAFVAAAELAPNDPRPVYNRGLLLDKRGYVQEAREQYARALERDDQYLPALRAAVRADARRNQGSMQTLEWVEKALMLEEDPAWIKWLRLQKIRIENLPNVKAQIKG